MEQYHPKFCVISCERAVKVQGVMRKYKKEKIMTKLLQMLKEECNDAKVKSLRKRGKFSDQYETP